MSSLVSRPDTHVRFLNWLISLDDADGQGPEDRRVVRLQQIIDRAKGLMDPSTCGTCYHVWGGHRGAGCLAIGCDCNGWRAK